MGVAALAAIVTMLGYLLADILCVVVRSRISY